MGADWTAFAAATSNVPFRAIAQSRNRLVLGELWIPIVAGFVAYASGDVGPRWISGVPVVC